jgi:hypothetical protein
MTVETATTVDQLNALYPASGDSRSEGDDHVRLIKSALLGSFTGASTTGVTGFNVVTQPDGNNTTLAASTAFTSAAIAAAALSATLPSQSGNAGKVIRTDGTNATWGDVLARVDVSGTTQTATAGNDYWLTNVAATAVTAPTGVDGKRFAVTPANGLMTNTVDFGAATVRGPSTTATGVITINLGARMEFVYSSTISKWVLL